MFNALAQLNYLAVFVTAIAAFGLGWLWYSPVLFAKPWMAEMKFTEDTMRAAAAKGMARLFVPAFCYTLVSVFGLAVLIQSRPAHDVVRGAGIGAFVGLVLVGARILNKSVWEQSSARLMSIVVGHEIVMFTFAGLILGAWL